jgi:hypothetical protein
MSPEHKPVKIVMRQYARPRVALRAKIIRALWIAVAVISLGSFLFGVWFMGENQDHQVIRNPWTD